MWPSASGFLRAPLVPWSPALGLPLSCSIQCLLPGICVLGICFLPPHVKAPFPCTSFLLFCYFFFWCSKSSTNFLGKEEGDVHFWNFTCLKMPLFNSQTSLMIGRMWNSRIDIIFFRIWRHYSTASDLPVLPWEVDTFLISLYVTFFPSGSCECLLFTPSASQYHDYVPWSACIEHRVVR